MWHKILGLALITPFLIVLCACVLTKPADVSTSDFLGCCITTVLLIEAFAIGWHLLFK